MLLALLDLYRDSFVNFWAANNIKINNHNNNNNNSLNSACVSFANDAWGQLFPPLLHRCLGVVTCPADVASRIAELLVEFTLLADSSPPAKSVPYTADGVSHQLSIKGGVDLINFLTNDRLVGIGVLTSYLTRLLNSSAIYASINVSSLTKAMLSTWFRFQICGGLTAGAVGGKKPLSSDARHLSQQLFLHHPLVAKICKDLNPDFVSLQVTTASSFAMLVFRCVLASL